MDPSCHTFYLCPQMDLLGDFEILMTRWSSASRMFGILRYFQSPNELQQLHYLFVASRCSNLERAAIPSVLGTDIGAPVKQQLHCFRLPFE
jgi:hypothetical protein